MRKTVARKITNWTIKYSPLVGEEEEVVCYGLEMLLENIETIFIFLCVGFIMNKGLETMTALAGFSILRSQAGGVHCKERWQCRLCMGIVVVVSVVLPEVFVSLLPVRSLLYIAMIVVLYLRAPVSGKKIKIEAADLRKKKRNLAIMIVVSAYLFSCIVTDKLAMTLMVALAFEVLSLMVGI